MGVQQSKHSYVYKPKKKLRKKTLHNSVFMEKPEYLIYDDVVHNNYDNNSKYNTTKSCIDIRGIQKRKDQARPLSLDEDMLERPTSNITNAMHQFRQEVAGQIAKMAPPMVEIVSSKSQGSSDGFRDVYDDDYYDRQMDSEDFKDAMSYHSLEFETVRPIEVDGAAEKLNKSVEFEFERVGKRVSRKSSSRRVQIIPQVEQENPSTSSILKASTSSNIPDPPSVEIPAAPTTPIVTLEDTVIPKEAVILEALKIQPSTSTVTSRQTSTDSTFEDPITPKEIITLEDVTNILQDIKEKILHGDINDTEVYHQLLMCKKKAQGIHVTSIKIRAKKTMLIGKINKFIHWFAISEPNKQEDVKKNDEETEVLQVNENRRDTDEEFKNHYGHDVGTEAEEEKQDARPIFIVNTMKEEQQETANKTELTNPFITPQFFNDVEEAESTNIIYQDDVKSQEIVEPALTETSNYLVQNSSKNDTSINQEDQKTITEPILSNIYEQISNIRLVLQKVHDRMDAYTGIRYDIEYSNILDEVLRARILLNNVKSGGLLEEAITEDYEKFFDDLLMYFEELVDRNETIYENVHINDPDTTDGSKVVRFERQNSLGDSEYYVNVNNQLSFDYKSETSTNLSESEDENSTHFLSLTEYDGKVIQTCETFNKNIQLQEDDADLSPDDDFIYKTNAVGQIVFEHEESQTPFIVDPISFSKCRMRPLSIIQEQLDEFLDCQYQEKQEKPITEDIADDREAESEDREDWGSFDENMVQNEQSKSATYEDDEEITEFEELEQNIDNIRISMPDLVLKSRYNDDEYAENYENSDVVLPQSYTHLESRPNVTTDNIEDAVYIETHHVYDNSKEVLPENYTHITSNALLPNDGTANIEDDEDNIYTNHDNASFEEGNYSRTNEQEDREQFLKRVQHYDNYEEQPGSYIITKELIPTRRSSNLEEALIANDYNNIENIPGNGFYSLESMSDGVPEDEEEANNYKIDNKEAWGNQYKDPQTEDVLTPPPGSPPPLPEDTQNNEDILNINNYIFNATELKSYNEIMKINTIIDNLQSQIDNFSGTKTSPAYMSTFKQIFDNMRVLNNIDNCDYQDDILNLIDYTSDKIQKCIFELDLKVS